jgi:hypothetical protein
VNIMMNAVPGWVWLVPLLRPVLTVGFVLLAGTIQGRTTGTWPTLSEWCGAVHQLHPLARLTRRGPGGRIGPSSDQDDEPIPAVATGTNRHQDVPRPTRRR